MPLLSSASGQQQKELPSLIILKSEAGEPRNSLEDGSAKYEGEFSKWNNGGGVFHSLACIDPTAVIEVGAIVHSKAMVGANVHIGSGAVIGPAVSIGGSTKIGYNAVLSNCSIGDSCAVYNGVCIGQDGFGFFVDDQGNMVKKPQLLNVRIGNNVEIGANSCVDRGRLLIMWSLEGAALSVDKSELQVLQRDYVTLGGRVAVRDHVSVASKVRLAANSCVTKDISEPGDYAGFPAVPAREWRRQVANQRRISKQGGS
ncbi:unnamed protein product [Linum tenue]|uniref:Uncharacterized protein n=1 Tax=Linum tenue TaxID=586396 RepID=A0AAV0PAS9_9ROSI|nr:unnamed protein product [Linum tenue]